MTYLNCSNNKLTDLAFSQDCGSLKQLYLQNNNFCQDLSFLQGVVNLEYLGLRNNKFYGSLEFLKEMKQLKRLGINDTKISGFLEPLQDLSKLKRIDISNTDIDSGLEYLPNSIEDFACLADKRKDVKCQTIFNLFANEQGIVEIKNNSSGKKYIKNFSQKLQAYKQKLQEQSQQQSQILHSPNYLKIPENKS